MIKITSVILIFWSAFTSDSSSCWGLVKMLLLIMCSIIIIISVTFILLSKLISANSKSDNEMIDILLSFHWFLPIICKSLYC